jgi:hypothetical protein
MQRHKERTRVPCSPSLFFSPPLRVHPHFIPTAHSQVSSSARAEAAAAAAIVGVEKKRNASI